MTFEVGEVGEVRWVRWVGWGDMCGCRKKILQTEFRGKKPCDEMPGEKYPALEKIFLMAHNAGK